MSQTLAALLDSALALPEPDRAELAKRLTASLAGMRSGLHPAWADELHRRAAEIDSGTARAIPGDEVRRTIERLIESGGPTHG